MYYQLRYHRKLKSKNQQENFEVPWNSPPLELLKTTNEVSVMTFLFKFGDPTRKLITFICWQENILL